MSAQRSRRIAQPSTPLPPDPAFTQARLDFAVAAYPDSLEARFRAYHAAHPDVYAAFRREAIRLRNQGKRHTSAKRIIEDLRDRWDAPDGRDADNPFRLNNNHTSRYARMLYDEDPARWAGFFSFRLLKSA